MPPVQVGRLRSERHRALLKVTQPGIDSRKEAPATVVRL
jgi:hypothetical protein